MPSTIKIRDKLHKRSEVIEISPSVGGTLLQSDHAYARAAGATVTTVIGIGLGSAAVISAKILNFIVQPGLAMKSEPNNETSSWNDWLPALLAAGILGSAVLAAKSKKIAASIGSLFSNPPTTIPDEPETRPSSYFIAGEASDFGHPYLLNARK